MVTRRKPTTGKALTSWKERAAARAKAREANIPSVDSSSISTRGGVLSWGGVPQQEPMPVVVLDECVEHAYYEGEFDPNSIDSPVCFAISETASRTEKVLGDGLAPHPDSPKPQNATCRGCWANEFGSATKGRGKACGNRRRLAVAGMSNVDPSNLAHTDVAILKVPPTGLKVWDGYVRFLARFEGIPPEFAITDVTMQKTTADALQSIPHYKLNERVTEDMAEVILQLQESCHSMLTKPYEAAVPEAPRAAPVKKQTRRATTKRQTRR